MSHHTHCSSSSDSSERCEKVYVKHECKKKCEKPLCNLRECEGFRADELACWHRNAVVQITSEWVLVQVGAGESIPPVVGRSIPGAEADARFDLVQESNGFFIKGHFIIVPAHAVILPPTYTSVFNRFPFVTAGQGAPTGIIQEQPVKPTRILVAVRNVNNEDRSYSYEATLVGYDGAGDVAVLKIDQERAYNTCNPCIEKCHPYLEWGRSRESKVGEKAYLLGNQIGPVSRRSYAQGNDIAVGHVANNRYCEYLGWFLPEAILLDIAPAPYRDGQPILDMRGTIIGMQTLDTYTVTSALGQIFSINDITSNNGIVNNNNLIGGPSQKFMNRSIKAIIGQYACPNSKEFRCQLEPVLDELGNYLRYVKPYAGIAYDVVTPKTYDVVHNFNSGDDNAGFDQIRLDGLGGLPSSPNCKEIIGIRVLAVAGLSAPDGTLPPASIPIIATGTTGNNYFYVPGGIAYNALFDLPCPFPFNFPFAFGLSGSTGDVGGIPFVINSPFLGKIAPGDIITHINSNPLGNYSDGKQIAPALLTWSLERRKEVKLNVRRGGTINGVGTPSFSNYDVYDVVEGNLTTFPTLLDWPWYAINVFPLLDSFPLPSVILPTSRFPQVPQLQGAGVPGFGGNSIFHPAF